MSFITFLVMMIISSAAEGASQQKMLSKFGGVFPHYEWYRNRSNYTLPDDFVVRTSRPEIIHLCLSIWIMGMQKLFIFTIHIQITDCAFWKMAYVLIEFGVRGYNEREKEYKGKHNLINLFIPAKSHCFIHQVEKSSYFQNLCRFNIINVISRLGSRRCPISEKALPRPGREPWTLYSLSHQSIFVILVVGLFSSKFDWNAYIQRRPWQ